MPDTASTTNWNWETTGTSTVNHLSETLSKLADSSVIRGYRKRKASYTADPAPQGPEEEDIGVDDSHYAAGVLKEYSVSVPFSQEAFSRAAEADDKISAAETTLRELKAALTTCGSQAEDKSVALDKLLATLTQQVREAETATWADKGAEDGLANESLELRALESKVEASKSRAEATESAKRLGALSLAITVAAAAFKLSQSSGGS